MTLDELLQHQQSRLQLLLDLTGQELELIIRRQALELPALAQRKESLLAEIQHSDRQIASHPESPRLSADLAEQVAELRQLLQHCQDKTRVTEQLLEQTLASNRRLANAMSQLHERQSMTYDHKGHTKGINKGTGFKV
ncbi:flagella synthesis protein FlgN [Zobellella denitrificans]|jgi:flagella synthesis protein FlgN|uniref:Flagellar biosynthesis protein FlgN n=1 Tax=Zobellella denitrificans TaxID=347534 RepID=A0A291HM07_9GAMM|nr:flagellar export chaperone FlgN [Zobellella denitrificans]ATG73173.1 flagellar biosynthesis protein FlgN [Zobellella denitrificans]